MDIVVGSTVGIIYVIDNIRCFIDWEEHSHCEKYTDKKRIEAWVKNFELFGIVKNLNKKSDRQGSHSGRKRVRYEAVIERIRDYVKTPQNGASERGRNLLQHTP